MAGVVPSGSDPFVSPPFNLVLVVVLGLVFAHNRHLSCFCAVCAFLGLQFLSKLRQDTEYSWQFHLPVVKFPDSAEDYAESESGVLQLACSVASMLWSAQVCRALWRILPAATPMRTVMFVAAFAVFFIFRAEALGVEMADLWARNRDLSVSWYLLCSQGVESLRAALQGIHTRSLICAWEASVVVRLIPPDTLSPRSEVFLKSSAKITARC